jgi:hypothetical protein
MRPVRPLQPVLDVLPDHVGIIVKDEPAKDGGDNQQRKERHSDDRPLVLQPTPPGLLKLRPAFQDFNAVDLSYFRTRHIITPSSCIEL